MNLSVCMIVKDEQQVLARCLDCVGQFAEEIVIVDTGSKDDTKKIALSYTDKVFDFKWNFDFSAARNYSFSKASCDLVMWLDADDVILPEDIEKINKLKQTKDPADIYMFQYVLTHEHDMTPIFKYARERVFLASKNFKWVDAIHEVIVPSGRVEYVDINIYHEKVKPTPAGRNLKIYRKMIKNKVIFSPRQQFYYARELMFNAFYKSAICQLKKFLKRPDGWVENKVQACIDLSSCYQALGKTDEALESLLKSFVFSTPRSEAMCRIGEIFLQKNCLDEAIFWYKQALASPPNYNSGAFIEKDMHDIIPALQLCLAYYKKGDYENSYKYHLVSKSLNAKHPSVVYNQKFFAKHFEKNDK